MTLLGRVVHPPGTEEFTSREVHPKELHVAVDGRGFLQQSPETSGYDLSEGVFKVANYVWDTDVLTWVRATQSAGGGGGSPTSTVKAKKYDQASPTTLYIGEADPGSATSSSVWRVKKITFDGAGFPASIDYAALGAATQIWDNRASLTY